MSFFVRDTGDPGYIWDVYLLVPSSSHWIKTGDMHWCACSELRHPGTEHNVFHLMYGTELLCWLVLSTVYRPWLTQSLAQFVAVWRSSVYCTINSVGSAEIAESRPWSHSCSRLCFFRLRKHAMLLLTMHLQSIILYHCRFNYTIFKSCRLVL